MDGGEVLHIGSEVAPWQIKDFSVALRKAITEAARRHDATVAEWLHGHFTRYGLEGVEIAPQTRQALPGQAIAMAGQTGQASPGQTAELRARLAFESLSVLSAAVAAGVELPKASRRHAAALYNATMRELRGLQPRQPRLNGPRTPDSRDSALEAP